MTYGQVKDAALHLIKRYSIAGTQIAASYNNQSDTLNAIPPLVDAVAMQIATTVRPISEMVALSSLSWSEQGGMYLYTLPANCWRLANGPVVQVYDGEVQRIHGVKVLADKYLLLPEDTAGSLSVLYDRYPMSVGVAPPDDLELDNAADTHMPMAYYVAAHLVLEDDTYAYAALMGEFEVQLTRLIKPVRTEIVSIVDVYGGFYG